MADHVPAPPPPQDPGLGTHPGADHSHPHPAGGAAHVSAHNPGAGQGPVVLDLGDDVGALVLHTTEELVGHEVDISPVEDPSARRHVEVLPRRTAAGVRFSAVYGSLTEGDWTLWIDAAVPAMTARVHGGRVTEVHWPVQARSAVPPG